MSQTNGTPRVRRRRGPGPHIYAVRRLLVLVASIGVLAGAFSLVNALTGDDDVQSSAHDSTATSSTSSTVAATTTTGSTTTTVKEVTVPTPQNPAELLVMGDSDAGNYGPALQRLLADSGLVITAVDYHIASGLARPDFFDWPVYMRQLVPQINPDIVVVTFGGNDAQGLRNADGVWVVGHNPGQGKDDTNWRAEYGRRVGETMDYLMEGNRTLIWVGITNDDEAINTARLKVQDEVVREQVALHPGVLFVDAWTLFSSADGGWVEAIVDPRDGVGKDVRRADGFHLNDAGAEILAWKIEAVVLDELRARGAKI